MRDGGAGRCTVGDVCGHSSVASAMKHQVSEACFPALLIPPALAAATAAGGTAALRQRDAVDP